MTPKVHRIVLAFDHPPCEGVNVDVTVPLPDPIQESAEAMAERYRHTCPLCKEPARYVGFHFDVHWRFKEEATAADRHLCDFPRAALDATHSIVLRPVIRQKPGGRLRECARCAKIGKELGIP